MKYAILALFFAVNAKAGILPASQPATAGAIVNGSDFDGDNITANTISSTGTAPSATLNGAVVKATFTATGDSRIDGSLLVVSTLVSNGAVFKGSTSVLGAGALVSSGALTVDGSGGQFRYRGADGVMALSGVGGGRGLFLDASVGALLSGVATAAVPYFQANAGEANMVSAGGQLSCTTAGCGANAAGVANRSFTITQRAADLYAVQVASQDLTAMAVVDRQGNLGIGTASPASKLHVSSGASNTETILTLDGSSNSPLVIQSTNAIRNVMSVNPNRSILLGQAQNALVQQQGVLVGLNDILPSRGVADFGATYGGGFGTFGTRFDGQELRTLKVGVFGATSLDDNNDGGKVGIWTGSGAAQKHMFSQNGRLGLNVATNQPTATLQVINATHLANYAVQVTSQDAVTDIFTIDSFGHFSSSAATNAALGTCTNGAIRQPSNDKAGIVDFSGANSSCALAFANSYPAAGNLVCTYGVKQATPAAGSSTVTKSGFTYVTTSFASGDELHYHCEFVGM